MQDEIEQSAFAWQQRGRERRARDRRRQPLPGGVDAAGRAAEDRSRRPSGARSSARRGCAPSGTPTRPHGRSQAVREAAHGEQNLLPVLRDALRAHCTVGELCETLREEWGMYDAVRSRPRFGCRSHRVPVRFRRFHRGGLHVTPPLVGVARARRGRTRTAHRASRLVGSRRSRSRSRSTRSTTAEAEAEAEAADRGTALREDQARRRHLRGEPQLRQPLRRLGRRERPRERDRRAEAQVNQAGRRSRACCSST